MARVLLARPWDGRRLLRLIAGLATGLAMLAIAFTSHLSGPAEATFPAPPPATVARVEAVTVADRAPALRPAPIEPAVAGTLVLLAVLPVLLTGLVGPVRRTRAPPLA
ncbi:hypothetical protein ACWKSP_25940 [Micromonosporaceae bacterium Da 78-11]